MALDKVVDSAALHDELVSIADSIRAKGGTDAQFASAAEMKAAVDAIETGGGSDTIKIATNQKDAYGMFDSISFDNPDTELDITFKTRSFTGSMDFFMSGTQNIKKLILNMPNIDKVSFERAFNARNSLRIIDFTNAAKPLSAREMFYGSINLETIIGELDFSESSNNTNAFSSCASLITVSFVPESIKRTITFGDCYVLSAESIQSIIDGLATVTSTQTLTMDELNPISESQKAQITSKNWTLVQ